MSTFANVDLRRLRVFVHVVDEGGLSSAAKRLFSTQSTVSKAIHIACRTGQIDLLYGLVASGAGIALVPSVVARTRKHPNVHTVAFEENLHWEMAHVWRRNAYLSHSARAWLALDAGNAATQASGGGPKSGAT